MSEKSWDLFSPRSFDTKLPLFTFTSTYLIFVFFFCAIMGDFIYGGCLFRYINIMVYSYRVFCTLYGTLMYLTLGIFYLGVLCFGGDNISFINKPLKTGVYGGILDR